VAHIKTPAHPPAEKRSDRDRIEIAGRSVAPGERVEIDLQFSESYLGQPVSVPISVTRAAEPGPVLLITSAIHGDELNGIGIVRELLYKHAREIVRGTLICVPVVNVLGVENHARYMPDRRDLNRSFPGAESGSITSRLAYVVYNELVQLADYCIDFHTAAVRRTNYPNIRADIRRAEIREIAEVFGCEIVVHGQGPAGSLRRTASSNGIPTIILEAGEVWKIEPRVREVGVQGCLNVMRHLGMLGGDLVRPLYQTVSTKTTWVRAERGGLLDFHVLPGAVVEAGDMLAHAQNVFGREFDRIESPVNGFILGMTTLPVVKPGEPIYHVAVLNRRETRRIKRMLAKSADGHLSNRLRDDLATNVTIHEDE
jgi:uncharacterized protein